MMEKYFIRNSSFPWIWEEVSIEEAFQIKEIIGFEQDSIDSDCFYALYQGDYQF